jgi:hypothetical protein
MKGTVSWVVYRMTVHKKPNEGIAVCEQQEWDAMERLQPGYHTLIEGGIANEAQAEQLARSSTVDSSAGKSSATLLLRR